MAAKLSLALDNEIYGRKAVSAASTAFREYCVVKATPLGGNKVELSFAMHEAHQGRAREVILEFLNFALDHSIQRHLEEAR